MRSARRAKPALAALAACALLVVAPLGCSTTQEKAAARQAESKRILEKRERKRHAKSHDNRSEQR